MPARNPIDDLKPHYPVLIIGAGINGCGTFRDLALQGVDCLLIDRGDVCEGASAASSRLIHGGIKYLETGEFRLVRESAMERNRLLRNAPHYVRPLETVLPVQSWLGGIVPSAMRFFGLKAKLKDRGAAITELGLRIYDAYNRKVQALPNHRFFGKAKLRAAYPALDARIIAAGLYYEGHITHAERLGLELVMDGLAATPGCELLTYAVATAAEATGGIRITDLITGISREVTADVIINAGGAWIDKVNEGLGITSRHIGGSKGSHLIIENPQLLAALQGRMIYFGTADGRVNLIYPFFGHVLVGSTDIPVKDADDAICDDGETDYLLATVAEIFPSIPITRGQILLTYCGVRPLPRAEGVDIGTVSRDHAIRRDVLPGTQRPVLSLIGGKWTTFRAFSAQAADDVLATLGRSRRVSTEDIAIGGGRGFPADEAAARQWARSLSEVHGLTQARAEALLARYGTTAEILARAIAASADKPLATLPGYSRAEMAWLCREEPLRRLSDLLFRRTTIAMEGLLTPAAIAEAAGIAADALDWSAERTAQEIALTTSEFTRRLPRQQHAA
jgi:glycerol-3-phosphate dehydrogenase